MVGRIGKLKDLMTHLAKYTGHKDDIAAGKSIIKKLVRSRHMIPQGSKPMKFVRIGGRVVPIRGK